ncbi:MAG: hypothetical protein E7588_09980 [Ruminococcaceae bacterium]|nr:hypothetical protein [Oscillospiraceae bacterium]
MKKAISLFLLISLIMCLCACGKTASKEDMLANAIELNWSDVYSEFLANEARAKNNYNGKVVKWTAKIYDISDKSVTMANETYNGLPLNAITVYLSNEDIIELDKYKKITVVGKLNLSSFTSISNAFIVE